MCGPMGKPLTPAERDETRRLASQRLTPTEVWKKVEAKRAQRRALPLVSTVVGREFCGVPRRVPPLVSTKVDLCRSAPCAAPDHKQKQLKII